jgi:hypothetical protein
MSPKLETFSVGLLEQFHELFLNYLSEMKDLTYKESGEIIKSVLRKPRSSSAFRTQLVIKKVHFCDQIQFRHFLHSD